MCVPNAWRPFSAARRYERVSQHPFRSDEVGKTLVDWKREIFHCELIQHPETLLNRLYNFILKILHSARKFQYSVRILDFFCLEIVSKVEH